MGDGVEYTSGISQWWGEEVSHLFPNSPPVLIEAIFWEIESPTLIPDFPQNESSQMGSARYS